MRLTHAQRRRVFGWEPSHVEGSPPEEKRHVSLCSSYAGWSTPVEATQVAHGKVRCKTSQLLIVPRSEDSHRIGPDFAHVEEHDSPRMRLFTCARGRDARG